MRDTRGLVYPIIVAFCSMLVMGVVTFALIRWSERQWCGLIAVLDEGYNAPVQPGQPPLNERGRRIADNIHELRGSLGCD